MRGFMRIIHLVNALEGGGVTSVAISLAARQQQDGHSVSVHELRRGAWGARAKAASLQVRVGLLAFRKAAQHADVIHCHHRTAGTLSVALGLGRKTVEHVHNVYAGHRLSSFRGRVIVGVSASVSDSLRTNYPHTAKKLKTVRNAIEEIPLPAVDRQSLIVGCGRLEEQKDPNLFLQIAEEYANLDTNFKWLWVGDGPMRDDWNQRRSGMLGASVDWIPELPRSDFIDQLARARILVMTSRWEGLPMVALEALAVGTPVMATSLGELDDLLLEAEGAQPLDRRNPGRAAAQVHHFLATSSSAETEAALIDFARRRLSLDAAIKRWEQIYSAVTGG